MFGEIKNAFVLLFEEYASQSCLSGSEFAVHKAKSCAVVDSRA